MHVKQITLNNFRNYGQASIDLGQGRNILLGENAQGKSNLIEAVELLANGYSDRAAHDSELIKRGSEKMRVELSFITNNMDETLSLSFRQSNENKVVEKVIQVNGVSYATPRKLARRLSVVSFKSEDLGLLRDGPKFRRDWLDRIILNLKPILQEKFSRYQKIVLQRNKLLKNLFEKGRVSTEHQDELKVWDKQVAEYGSIIAKERIALLNQLLPLANQYQNLISNQQETLISTYQLKSSSLQKNSEADESLENKVIEGTTIPIDSSIITQEELGQIILRSLQSSRYEEIARKQTLFGPHRDNIAFFLNDKLATSFASQGQQRSLVLSLKLAELKLVTDNLLESPVLLLDDVLAELDLNRQMLLMSLVKEDMQTIISTTHLSNFQPDWFKEATFIHVNAGTLTFGTQSNQPSSIYSGS